jgi:hypothetical protein
VRSCMKPLPPASVGVPSVPNCPTFPPCGGTLERSWMPWPNLWQSSEPIGDVGRTPDALFRDAASCGPLRTHGV